MACIPLWSSAVRVHDSQAYRKMVRNVLKIGRSAWTLSLKTSDSGQDGHYAGNETRTKKAKAGK